MSKQISRRRLLKSGSVLMGAAAVGMSQGASGREQDATCSEGDGIRREINREDYRPRYTPVSPAEAARLAYEAYTDGSCMYAVVKSVMSLVAREKDSVVPPIYYEMFKYGHGGVGGWGSLCGVCNGAATILGIFYHEKEDRDPLIGELFRWYESTELPEYTPSGPTEKEDVPKSRADSILCHLSTSMWCLEADEEAISGERKERCRRLSADGAKKVVEILNTRYQLDQVSADPHSEEPEAQPMGPPESCIRCHAKPGGKVDAEKMAPKAGVRMKCATCHEHDSSHPEMYDKPSWMKR